MQTHAPHEWNYRTITDIHGNQIHCPLWTSTKIAQLLPTLYRRDFTKKQNPPNSRQRNNENQHQNRQNQKDNPIETNNNLVIADKSTLDEEAADEEEDRYY